jgi:hypothetical protein
MNLHESKSDFRDLIAATAQQMNIRDVYVEKDYWVTLLLKRLSQHPESGRIIFKGGTSLSKGYGLIRRFSEDVDLAINSDGLKNSQIERLIKKVSKDLADTPFIEVDDPSLTSKMGMSRRTLHSYPRDIESNDFGPVRENILLEINCFGKPTPNLKKTIKSFITEFLVTTGQEQPISDFGLEKFEVSVLSYKRTFVEKILSLSYSSFEDGVDGDQETRARVRHFYDLSVLYGENEIRDFVHSDQFSEMMNMVREEERLSSRIKWAQHKLGESSLHSKSKKVLDRASAYYQLDLEPMVFNPNDLPSFEVVRSVFKVISALVIEKNL